MSAKAMAILAWSLWGVLLATLLVGMAMVVLDPRRSPEASRGLGPLVIGVLIILHLGLGGLLYWLAHRQSITGLVVISAFLGVPALLLVAQPAVIAFKTWSLERDQASAGDFRDPALRSIAEAVRAGDSAGLARLLAAQHLPAGRDRAGNDLLAFVLAEVRDRKGDMACLRALLEAGADPRASRNSDGQDPLNFMIVDITPTGREAALLLLKHGADANAVDPITGFTPIRQAGHDPELVRALAEAGAEIDRIQPDGLTALLHFVSTREWESAVYLIEHGARLDVSRDGLSLAYFEETWETSVYGETPEGWERVKQAIAKRRAAAAAQGAGAGGQ